MKRDWDYVDFTDYKSDMDQLTDTADAVIEHLKHERDDARRMLIAAAISASGDLVIHGAALQRADDYDVHVERQDYDDTVRIRVKPKAQE